MKPTHIQPSTSPNQFVGRLNLTVPSRHHQRCPSFGVLAVDIHTRIDELAEADEAAFPRRDMQRSFSVFGSALKSWVEGEE